MDKWIGRNLLKVKSQSELNNPKHWNAKHFIPFQAWEVAPWSNIYSNLICLLVCAKGFKWGTGPRQQFYCVLQWRDIGVESGFMARAYEPGGLTRNSHDTGPCRKHWSWPQWQFQFQWQWPARIVRYCNIHLFTKYRLVYTNMEIYIHTIFDHFMPCNCSWWYEIVVQWHSVVDAGTYHTCTLTSRPFTDITAYLALSGLLAGVSVLRERR